MTVMEELLIHILHPHFFIFLFYHKGIKTQNTKIQMKLKFVFLCFVWIFVFLNLFYLLRFSFPASCPQAASIS